MCLVNVVTCHSLQGLVEADGGGAVEDDVDTGSECLYILWTDGQAGLRELAADGDDLLMKVRIIFTHAVEQLRNTHRRARQRYRITTTTQNMILSFITLSKVFTHEDSMLLLHSLNHRNEH